MPVSGCSGYPALLSVFPIHPKSVRHTLVSCVALWCLVAIDVTSAAVTFSCNKMSGNQKLRHSSSFTHPNTAGQHISPVTEHSTESVRTALKMYTCLSRRARQVRFLSYISASLSNPMSQNTASVYCRDVSTPEPTSCNSVQMSRQLSDSACPSLTWITYSLVYSVCTHT